MEAVDDSDFCIIPLTNNMQINPFRCERSLWQTSPSLMHAVLALAGHHLVAPDVEDHRQIAIHALRRSLDTSWRTTPLLELLDTIIILFSLDVRL